MTNTPLIPHYEFNGGTHCLNFINTVWERVGYASDHPAHPHELLFSFKDVLVWAEQAQLLPESTLADLRESERLHPVQAKRAYRKLIDLRELLFEFMVALILRQQNLSHLLMALNLNIQTLPSQKLDLHSTVFTLQETALPGDLRTVEIALCRDVTHLLCSTDLQRLRICNAEDCGWVFLDTSKNGKRRWCSMSDCGNRDKVSRFLERRRDLSDSKAAREGSKVVRKGVKNSS